MNCAGRSCPFRLRPRVAKKPQTEPPERLSDEDRAWLRTWAALKEPQEVKLLLEHEEACFDHFRAKGENRVDWKLTVKNWTRNAKNFRRAVPTWAQPVAQRPIPTERGPIPGEDEMARRREEHRRVLKAGRAELRSLADDIKEIVTGVRRTP